MLKRTALLSICFCVTIALPAQEKHVFENEVKALVLRDSLITNRKDIILFTGSSSIRMWTDLEKDFADKNVLNRAFGGSTMRDLLYFADQLIVPYNPKTIFIYEGDNDLGFANATSQQILASADSLLTIIRAKLPSSVRIYFISPKPSIARWHLKDQYVQFNKDLQTWTNSKKNVYFIDVWSKMLDADGSLRKDLFIEDGLHMNRKGYDIWRDTLRKYVK
ncbi:MAG TPA: SGNH/GDSL hydrolase family protein [Cyclobacteriaceae bacterium]|nr:G-D-S-L family lipolytic protein [Cyclobacteriaceae bacterium]HMV10329.1 SGNH/GDSL hydrolase family protein [Cyclobacteriaceae bacterium]HMV89857.1 SGNH/GDSL hydrolase family protein [Cyclobacteriaceae bacterium]HMX02764.1 SGNH/GDSL hydrolase family protein [Cyclobacteriaceae bacterium]HMX50082.1 SGNH/GDSL hydrolase family protein [Cyclobacteriaceae bacterium]